MAKVTIIDVSLGREISDIISDDLALITTQTDKEISSAIEESKQLQAIRIARETEENKATQKIKAIIDTITSSGQIDSKKLLTMASPEYSSLSTVVQKVNAAMKAAGSAKKLTKVKAGSMVCYLFVELAQPTEEPSPAQPQS